AIMETRAIKALAAPTGRLGQDGLSTKPAATIRRITSGGATTLIVGPAMTGISKSWEGNATRARPKGTSTTGATPRNSRVRMTANGARTAIAAITLARPLVKRARQTAPAPLGLPA